MATVDKLTLQLDAEGMQKFIKSMEEAQNGLQKVRDNIRKTAEQNGLLDNKFERSSKKLSKIDKKKEQDRYKGYKLLNENFKQNAKSIDKMAKALLTVAGISFDFNSLMNKSSQAAATSTGYANRSRNSAATAQQLEALDTATRAEGKDGALNNLADKLSQNYLATQSGETPLNTDVTDKIIKLNGRGANIDYQNTDPINTIKKLNEFLLSVPKEKRAGLLEWAGFSEEEGEVLSSNTLSASIVEAMKHTIQTPERVEAGRKNQADLTYSWTDVQNEWNKLGQDFTPVVIAMNKIAATILKEVNKLEPQIEAAMPKLEKVVENILKWTSKFVSGFNLDNGNSDSKITALTDEYISKNSSSLSDNEKDAIRSKLSNISSVNTKDGTINLSSGDPYEKGGSWRTPDFLGKYYEYILSEYGNKSLSTPFYNLNDGKYQPANQIMGQQYANQNNSQSQNISIGEMHVMTNASNVPAIVNDGLKSSNLLVGSATNLAPYLSNTK